MNKTQAIQHAVNAVAVAAQVINDYGRHSSQARAALDVARDATCVARTYGATDDEIRAAHAA